jgi:hypothetical protein
VERRCGKLAFLVRSLRRRRMTSLVNSFTWIFRRNRAMKTNNYLAAFALSAILALSQSHAQEDNQQFMGCAKECNACEVRCNQCFRYCLEQAAGGKSEHAKTGKLCANCAEICKTCAVLCARECPHSAPVIEGCAIYCEACEKECRKMEGDKTMEACANACRACAKECRQMAMMKNK